MDVSGQEEKYITEQQHFRIPLNNRTNKYLKILPSELLKAYATGKIKAYYSTIELQINIGTKLQGAREVITPPPTIAPPSK